MLDLVQGNDSPPTKCKWRSLLYPQISAWSDLQFWRWSNFHILAYWLEIGYSRPLLGGFGGIFSPNDVTYRCNPQKALPCVESRRLSHKAWKSVQRFDLGAFFEKKRRLHDSTVKKVTKALYFTYVGRSPHWTDFHKKLHSSCRPRRNHACKLLSWNFEGLRFYRGSNFPFSYRFFHGPYNSAALLRCLWLVDLVNLFLWRYIV